VHGSPLRVRVVVLNFNGGWAVESCIAALLATDWPAGALDVVLIDNASTDGSADAVVASHPEVRLVRNGTNTGFPANNLALRDLGDADYVALVNNDAFVEPGWLRPLVEELESDRGLGAANPLILFDGRPVDTVNNAGNEVLANGYGRDRGFGSTDVEAFAEPCDVFAWCGAAVLLRPTYLADVGLFDERFFLYYEDTDLSWRGQLRGWRYRFVPASVVRHLHAASAGEGSELHRFYTERNRLLMLAKNAPSGMVWRALWRFPLSTLSYARHRDWPAVRVRVRSYRAFLGLLPAVLKDRRRVRRRATQSDAVVVSRLTPVEPRARAFGRR
jgi:N-acetylglucosaminyl-diphospho-decaprenol L-rhamnosyltransferase